MCGRNIKNERKTVNVIMILTLKVEKVLRYAVNIKKPEKVFLFAYRIIKFPGYLKNQFLGKKRSSVIKGIKGNTKRQYIFNWLKKSHNGVIFLQETHCIDVDEFNWHKEVIQKGYFSNRTHSSSKRKVIPNNLQLEFKVLSHKTDLNG